MSEQQTVLFEELPAVNNKKVAVATLNAEKSLNALSVAMIERLQTQLSRWEVDAKVACVVLQGAGDRAFCAGGDVVALFNAATGYAADNAEKAAACDVATQFFSAEYRLDYSIHTFSKPLLVWGHGIVMGGGIGLLSGASHRVVTEATRMAMPEVTIGLYPDVGASWFLNRAPGRSGIFLGITGAPLNAADAKFIGLGDRFIPNSEKAKVLEALAAAAWGNAAVANRGLMTHILRAFERAAIDRQPPGQVSGHLDWINDICDADSTEEIVARVCGYRGEDKWILKATKGLLNGCPVTPYLVVEQLRRGRHLSLADVFRMELIMSVNCVMRGHFREGVRALLIDKDNAPRWQPGRVGDVNPEEVEAFFTAPWGGAEHPLADL